MLAKKCQCKPPGFLIYYLKHFHYWNKTSWVKEVNCSFLPEQLSQDLIVRVCTEVGRLGDKRSVMTRFPTSPTYFFALAILALLLAHLILWQVSLADGDSDDDGFMIYDL